MSAAHILEKKGHKVFSIGENASLREAVKELADHHIGALVVMNANGEVVGMLSERDVIRELALADEAINKGVSHVMTGTICKCALDDTEGSMMEQMAKAGVRHLPVEHFGRIVGLISARDILTLRIEKLNDLMKEIQTEAAKK